MHPEERLDKGIIENPTIIKFVQQDPVTKH